MECRALTVHAARRSCLGTIILKWTSGKELAEFGPSPNANPTDLHLVAWKPARELCIDGRPNTVPRYKLLRIRGRTNGLKLKTGSTAARLWPARRIMHCHSRSSARRVWVPSPRVLGDLRCALDVSSGVSAELSIFSGATTMNEGIPSHRTSEKGYLHGTIWAPETPPPKSSRGLFS